MVWLEFLHKTFCTLLISPQSAVEKSRFCRDEMSSRHAKYVVVMGGTHPELKFADSGRLERTIHLIVLMLYGV